METASVVPGRVIRDARERAGLSQRELAERAGTSQPTVSSYERGHKIPSAATLVRLVRAAGAELTATAPDNVRAWLAATDGLADQPSDAFPRAARRVRGGEDVLMVFRELLDELYLWEEVRGEQAVELLLAEPAARTGDSRADALFAGLAEHVAVTSGLDRPAWVCEPARFLTRWWFPHRRRGFDALAIRDAPAAFRRRGVMLHPSMLERA